MGRFADMADVKPHEGGVYFLEGVYDKVEIQKVDCFHNRSKLLTFTIKGKVIEGGPDKRGPGSIASQVIVIKPQHAETHWGNIKAFAGALLGIDTEDPGTFLDEVPEDEDDLHEAIANFWDETMEYMVSDEQPFKGEVLGLCCTNIETKSGNEFTKHEWTPVAKEDSE